MHFLKSGRETAINYAKKHFSQFANTNLLEIQKLMTSLLFQQLFYYFYSKTSLFKK